MIQKQAVMILAWYLRRIIIITQQYLLEDNGPLVFNRSLPVKYKIVLLLRVYVSHAILETGKASLDKKTHIIGKNTWLVSLDLDH